MTESILPSVVESEESILFKYPCALSSKTCFPYEILLDKGTFIIECWGAAGLSQNTDAKNGYGGYTKGVLSLNSQLKLYLYVGAQGFFNSIPIFTTSTISYYLGGGASDIRLSIDESNPAKWDSFDSLKSRIMVAGGGGGCEWRNSIGGNGGGLNGEAGYGSVNPSNPQVANGAVLNKNILATGGFQTKPGYFSSPYHSGMNSSFGRAGFLPTTPATLELGGFGGGGYYGGASMLYTHGGGGGSSFISGYPECDAISADSTDFDNIIHTKQPRHYSGIRFSKGEMKSGSELMPNPESNNSKDVIEGNNNVGFIKITRISPSQSFTVKKKRIGIRSLFLGIIFMPNSY